MTTIGIWDEPGGSRSRAEAAYYELRARLVSLRIPPGSVIHEESLCLELGIGRTPVREAIKRLEVEQLVEVFPRRGTFATQINITDHSLIADVRRELERHAAAQAAKNATAPELAELRRLEARLDQAEGPSVEDAMRLDAELHAAIYKATHNPYLEATLGQYYNMALRLWFVFLDRVEDVARHVGGHRALLEAIIGRDPAAAARLAEAHVDDFERAVLVTRHGA